MTPARAAARAAAAQLRLWAGLGPAARAAAGTGALSGPGAAAGAGLHAGAPAGAAPARALSSPAAPVDADAAAFDSLLSSLGGVGRVRLGLGCRGRGLFAAADTRAGELLLAMPLRSALVLPDRPPAGRSGRRAAGERRAADARRRREARPPERRSPPVDPEEDEMYPYAGLEPRMARYFAAQDAWAAAHAPAGPGSEDGHAGAQAGSATAGAETRSSSTSFPPGLLAFLRRREPWDLRLALWLLWARGHASAAFRAYLAALPPADAAAPLAAFSEREARAWLEPLDGGALYRAALAQGGAGAGGHAGDAGAAGASGGGFRAAAAEYFGAFFLPAPRPEWGLGPAAAAGPDALAWALAAARTRAFGGRLPLGGGREGEGDSDDELDGEADGAGGTVRARGRPGASARGASRDGASLIVPCVDFLNHSSAPNAEFWCERPDPHSPAYPGPAAGGNFRRGSGANPRPRRDCAGARPPPPLGRFEVTALMDIPAGAEVLICYGDRLTSADLLESFGFVEPGNASDRLRLEVRPAPPHAPLALRADRLAACVAAAAGALGLPRAHPTAAALAAARHRGGPGAEAAAVAGGRLAAVAASLPHLPAAQAVALGPGRVRDGERRLISHLRGWCAAQIDRRLPGGPPEGPAGTESAAALGPESASASGEAALAAASDSESESPCAQAGRALWAERRAQAACLLGLLEAYEAQG